MKPVAIGLALLSLVGTIWSAEQTMTARVTVYWRDQDQSRARWNDIPLQDGHCAVDPHKIPYGSKVVVDGDELTAVDTGPAVISRKAARTDGRTKEERRALVIDRYFKSKEAALAWARSHPPFMQVRVVPPGSSETVQAGVAGSDTTAIPRFDWRWLAGIAVLAALSWPFLGMPRRTTLNGGQLPDARSRAVVKPSPRATIPSLRNVLRRGRGKTACIDRGT